MALLFLGLAAGTASATNATVELGNASNFAILAGSAITGTGTNAITGDVGLDPTGGAAITLLTCSEVTGTIYDNNGLYVGGGDPANVTCRLTNASLLNTAKIDLITAYDDAEARTPATSVAADLGGQILTPGVYSGGTGLTTGTTLTLDGQGDPNAVFIFKASSTLITAVNSNVILINGTQARNVFWQVTSSATLGSNSTFKGTILALTAITLNTGANVEGRVLARNAEVTLDGDNVITAGPDLSLTNITFVYDPGEASEVTEAGEARENINLTINATIYNIGISSSGAFNVLFYDNNSEFYNTSMNSIPAGGSANATTYWTTLAGTHNITVKVDPAGATSDTDRSNNNASKLINVSAWQKYYGNAAGNYILANNLATSMKNWTWNYIGYLYVVNKSASINWSALHPLGYYSNNTANPGGQDFQDADTNLGLVAGTNNATGFRNNNITELFTNTTGSNYGNVATNTASFVIFGITINNVPVVNSTDMTHHNAVGSANFITGILWDDTNDTNGYYDISDKEDLVFITIIRSDAPGLKGSTHNYEIAVPYSLNSIMGGDVDMYMELT